MRAACMPWLYCLNRFWLELKHDALMNGFLYQIQDRLNRFWLELKQNAKLKADLKRKRLNRFWLELKLNPRTGVHTGSGVLIASGWS